MIDFRPLDESGLLDLVDLIAFVSDPARELDGNNQFKAGADMLLLRRPFFGDLRLIGEGGGDAVSGNASRTNSGRESSALGSAGR